MYPIYPYVYAQKHEDRLIKDIAKAINGQYSAISCYKQLAKLAPTEEERKRILEIRQDEIRHYHAFSDIYTRLTGQTATPSPIEPCPTNYKEGLKFAIQDEQETVDFYLDIADQAKDKYIQHAFRRAAADEQNHAVWFLYFYTKLCCKD